MMNQLQIFAARMQDRDPPRLLQNLPQAAEIADGDGIDERQLFSIKQLKPPTEQPVRRPPAFEGRRPGPMDSRRPMRPVTQTFEDRLTKFLKDSDERLTDLKRATDSKRGGRGSRRSD